MTAVAPFLILHVALAIPPGALPPRTLAAAVAEAAAIWARYGVVVDVAGHCEAPSDDTAQLAVAVVTGSDTSGAPFLRPPLGAIRFDPDGAPAPEITLFLGAIQRFVSTARVLGVDDARWPGGLRERIVGRAAGRVLAHEIGHYLLRTPRHDTVGLMRSMRSADDFASPARGAFELSKATAARLAQAQTQAPTQTPTPTQAQAQAQMQAQAGEQLAWRTAHKHEGPAVAGPSNRTRLKAEKR
jgi:hypothetical protein